MISRVDLTPGQRAVQAGHACFEFAVTHPEVTDRWCPGYLIFLETHDESDLLAIANDAETHDVPFAVFREPDYNNAITAVALAPTAIASHLCAGLPLMLRSEDLPGSREGKPNPCSVVEGSSLPWAPFSDSSIDRAAASKADDEGLSPSPGSIKTNQEVMYHG